jgi:HK97 family phage prohead protease
MNLFREKDIIGEVKDFDSVSRRVKVAFARFGNVDSDGDVIMRGAFTKSINERGPESQTNRKIKFLRYHDFEHEIGKMESLEETNDFLVGVAKLGRATKGNDAFLDYEDGIITEHSIGFNIIPDKTVVRADGIREIKEVILWEGSAVTFGANSETPVFSVGKGNTQEYLDRLNTRMQGCIKALKNGQGTDDRLMQIEMNLMVIQSKYNDIINSLKEDKPKALEIEKPNEPKINYSISNFI